jgi:hypothetical protein
MRAAMQIMAMIAAVKAAVANPMTNVKHTVSAVPNTTTMTNANNTMNTASNTNTAPWRLQVVGCRAHRLRDVDLSQLLLHWCNDLL